VRPLGGCPRSRSVPSITMMRAVPLLLCILSARVAAQTRGHLRGANLTTEMTPCESLSETDPAPCPMTYGASGAAINTAKMCVYSRACAASGGLDCFEQTACKYCDGFGIDVSANLSSNTATASASTLAYYPLATECTNALCNDFSYCASSVNFPIIGYDWVGLCCECARGYSCLVGITDNSCGCTGIR
jgi:hypothetical protein